MDRSENISFIFSCFSFRCHPLSFIFWVCEYVGRECGKTITSKHLFRIGLEKLLYKERVYRSSVGLGNAYGGRNFLFIID